MSDEETKKHEKEEGVQGDGEKAAAAPVELMSEEVARTEGEDADVAGLASDAGGGKRAVANSIALARQGYRENMALLHLNAAYSYKSIVLAVGGALAFLVLAIGAVAFIVLSILNSDTETTTVSDNNESDVDVGLEIFTADAVKTGLDEDWSAAAFAEEIIAGEEASPKVPRNASGIEDSYLNVLDVA